MPSLVDTVANEFREEAKTTGRVLQNVPSAKLTWRPHATSMTLGQLALHIATVPGNLVKILQKDEHEISPKAFTFQDPQSVEEIHSTFQQSVRDADAYLSGMSEEQAKADWTLKGNGKTIFTKPRIGVVRMIMMNHIYHHRGQLSVYLRMVGAPVPSIYGPSADENPFG